MATGTTDHGLTHVALPVRDLERSIAFYAEYADMQVVHRRRDAHSHTAVAWLSDLTRPFVIVLIEAPSVEHGLHGPWCHLGAGVAQRAEVDARCERARAAGLTVVGPTDSGYPVGYWAYIVDPDGHNLELSFGQEVGFTVEHSKPA
jgi:catechol 2,3-dioxygenase-like lactoylglutathione lyase family enzyme